MTFRVFFSLLMGLGAGAFLVWCLWDLSWDLYDHWMEQRTRRRNTRFDARVGRDCYRDTKGVQR